MERNAPYIRVLPKQDQPDKTMETIIVKLNYLCERDRRELEAYRKEGHIVYFRYLKEQDARIRKLQNIVHKALDIILVSVCSAFAVWVLWSFIDVVCHNLEPNPVYQAWNIFTLF